MIWSAETVRGFAVHGLDGVPAGYVADMVYDEVWTVRAFVLAEGATLPVSQVSKLDGPRKLVQAKLSADRTGDGTAADSPDGGPHLYRLSALHGMELQATDGGVGPALDVMFQDSDWKIRFLVAEAGNGKGKVLIAVTSVTGIDRATGVLKLDLDRKAVNASPPFEGDLGVDGAGADDHQGRRSYFGVELVAPEKGPGLPD